MTISDPTYENTSSLSNLKMDTNSLMPSRFMQLFSSFTKTLIICDLIVIALTFFLTEVTSTDYFAEHTLFSIYSGLQIYLVAATILFCYFAGKLITNFDDTPTSGGYLFISAFFSVLATDEIFELHENGKMVNTITGYFFSWDPGIFYGELIIFAVYGLMALATGIILRKELLKYGVFRYLLIAGTALFMASLIVDVFFWSFFPVIYEDGTKVLGFGLIEVAFFYRFLLACKPHA